jgi:hypothetical protein
MFPVQVKWNKQLLGPIDLSPTDTFLELKNKLQPLTHVSPDKQKLLYKGRILKNTDTLSSVGLEEGGLLVMVGAAESSAPAASLPVSNLNFPMLADLGNSSHLNVTLQLLNRIPELQESLQGYNGSELPKYLKEVLVAMAGSRGQAISPVQLLAKVITVMPQFGQREAGGRLKRPDLGEFLMAFWLAAGAGITVLGEDGKERGLHRELFELQLEKPGKVESVSRLTATVDGCSTLEDGLKASLEKGGEPWQIAKLPPYIWIHTIGERKAGVNYPRVLDVTPLCTAALQSLTLSTRSSAPSSSFGLDQTPPTGFYTLLGLGSLQSLSLEAPQYVAWVPEGAGWVGLADARGYRVETLAEIGPLVLLYSRSA